MDMGTQGSGRKRLPTRERLTAEDDALNLIAREAEARLAAKRAARAEAREIRMKELERQQKEIYQVQKKYYGLDTKWGDIEQWMEDSERYSRRSRRNTSASDEDERLSVGSRGSLRAQPELECGGPCAWTNGYDGDYYGSQSLSRRSGRNSSYSGDSRFSSLSSSREKLGLFGSDLGFPSSGLASKPLSVQNGTRASVTDGSGHYGAWRGGACGSRAPSEYSGHLNSSSRASSRASSARASPVVEERPDKDFTEKGSRNMPSLSAATLASLGGTSSRRGSGDTSISVDTEASIREIKELNELKDQIQDVEGKYMQGLKEMKDSLAEVEEKYKRAMVSNAQLDNEKTNFMYQVDTLKDMLLELEEQLAESQRQYEEKNKEFEREKHAHSVLQFQFAEVKEALRQREEMLEKHGIILNTEIATNGETSDTLNNVGYQGSAKMTKEELNALKSTGEGTLGKAKEVEVTNGVVEDVGKGEILPSSEQEQHKEDTVKDREVLRAGENAEDQKPAEDRAPSPGPLAGAKCEQQVQSQVHKNTSFLENPEQIESHKVTDKPDTRTRNSLEHSCLGDLDSEEPGPTRGRGDCDASDNQDQSENSVGPQEIETLEDPKTDLKEASSEPCPDSDPGQTPEVTRVSCADSGGTGEINAENVADGGGTAVGEQGDMVASCPLEHRDSTASHDIRCVVDGMGPSTGQSSERERTQEVGQPEETLVQSPQAGGENTSRQDGDPEIRVEKPAQTEAQASPGAPVAQSIPQDAVGPGGTDTESASLDVKEPNQEKKLQQAETWDSPQKKTKNRKKKNKKKKAPAAAEALKDDRTDLDYQNTEAGDTEGEEQGQSTDKNRAADPQNGEVENPRQTIPAGSSEHAKAEADGKQSEEEEEKEEVKTQVGRATSGNVGDEEAEEHVAKGPEDGPGKAECEEGSSSSQLEKKSPPRDISSAAQIESTEEHVPATHSGQTAEKALDSGTLENDGPSGELGDFGSEGGGQARGTDEKGKSKEDCTMS